MKKRACQFPRCGAECVTCPGKSAIVRPSTQAQRNAFMWLKDRNGDGLFDRHQVLVAAGEKAPFMHATWNALRDQGFLEYYKTTGNATRVRVVK